MASFLRSTLIVLAAFSFAVALPACDSGGSDPVVPLPTPTPTPTVQTLSGTYRGTAVVPNSGGAQVTLSYTIPTAAPTGASFSYTATGSVTFSNGVIVPVQPESGIGEFNFPTVRFTSPDGGITTGTVASGGASFTILETVTGTNGQNSDVTITLTRL